VHRVLACSILLLLGAAPTAGADTLAEVLRASGLSPPAGLPDLDRPIGSHVIVGERGPTIVLYDAGEPGGSARLVALRLGPGIVTRVPLVWPRSAPEGLDANTCARVDSMRRHADFVVATAHVNPSAACTLVLGRDLALRAVLPGWPVATLPDGRIVYHRNQIHFASFHRLALHLFDPARLVDTRLHPRKPYQAARTAHLARMRRVYTEAWCSAHNHPCDPDVFDEHLTGAVLVNARGDALVFAVAFDNTTGWSDAERWGRLEPFRELRVALGRWDGRGEPPEALAGSLVAGLGRARNLQAEPYVAAALSGDPELRDLITAILVSPRPPNVDEARWLATLDPRWRDAATWLRLARLIDVPDELTEVVYVYAGLRPPARLRYRELPRREFEGRFGRGSLGVALEPAALRQLFGALPE